MGKMFKKCSKTDPQMDRSELQNLNYAHPGNSQGRVGQSFLCFRIEAEKLVENAETLFPGLVKAEEVLAGLYMDKAKLSLEVGDYLNKVDKQ